jgi:hypothetical protein
MPNQFRDPDCLISRQPGRPGHTRERWPMVVQERIGLLAWDRPHAAPTQVAQAILGK